MIIDSLFAKLGFDVDTEKLEEFNGHVREMRDTVLGLGAIFAGAASAIGLFVAHQADAIDDLADWAEIQDVAIEKVQELGYAAQLSGSSIDAVKASIEGLNRTIGEAALGIGRGAMTFKKLKISAKDSSGDIKEASDVLAEVAERMQGLSQQEAIALAGKLGIDQSLIPLLRKGAGEIARLTEEARAFGIASEADAQIAGDFNDAMDRTRFMVGSLSRTIAVSLMPRITGVLDGFRKWLVSNREIVKSTIGRVLDVLTTIIGRLWDALVGIGGALADGVQWMLQFRAVTLLAAAALALFAGAKTYAGIAAVVKLIQQATLAMRTFSLSALLIPAVIGAIVLAVAALIDDWMAWKEGGESVIGDLVEQFPALLGVIQQVEAAIGATLDYFAGLWSAIEEPVGNLLAALGNLADVLLTHLWPIIKTVLSGFAQLMLLVLPAVIRVVAGIVEGFVALLGVVIDVGAGIVSAITAVLDVVGAAFGVAFANLGDLWGALMAIFTGRFDEVGQRLMSMWARVTGFFTSGLEKIRGAVGWVADKLGLSKDESTVAAPLSKAPGLLPDAATAASVAMSGAAAPGTLDLLGRAATPGGNTSSVVSTTTNQIQAPINIYASDPQTAGDSVVQALDRVNRQVTRNGESAVAL